MSVLSALIGKCCVDYRVGSDLVEWISSGTTGYTVPCKRSVCGVLSDRYSNMISTNFQIKAARIMLGQSGTTLPC